MNLNNSHRYSMPISRPTNRSNETGFDGANVTRFLFEDDDSSAVPHTQSNNDSFPTLVRQNDQMVSDSFP